MEENLKNLLYSKRLNIRDVIQRMRQMLLRWNQK